jgi:hypothetical protein
LGADAAALAVIPNAAAAAAGLGFRVSLLLGFSVPSEV